MPTAYLDHAATSPVRPEVAEAMAPFAGARFGNASGSHRVARDARTALEEARDEVAALLGAAPREVVFTGGGTESDNLAVLGGLAASLAAHDGAAALVHSAVEHPAVVESARAAERGAARLAGVPPLSRRVAPVTPDGAVDPEALGGLLGPEVRLVSVMAANNETGTVQPLDEVARLVRRLAPRAVLHTDAVQAAPWLDLAVVAAGWDLVTVSAHKLGGPKGSGALVVREGVALEPLSWGGGQERERRSGTHDVAGAVGLAVALRQAAKDRDAEAHRVAALRDRLADGLCAVPGVTRTAPGSNVLPGHCHLLVEAVASEELLVLLDRDGVCAAAGSACASGALEPSPTLAAMGVPEDRSRGALRLTLGWTTTAAEVDHALAVVPAAVASLRR